jgi:hypothetical protein
MIHIKKLQGIQQAHYFRVGSLDVLHGRFLLRDNGPEYRGSSQDNKQNDREPYRAEKSPYEMGSFFCHFISEIIGSIHSS